MGSVDLACSRLVFVQADAYPDRKYILYTPPVFLLADPMPPSKQNASDQPLGDGKSPRERKPGDGNRLGTGAFAGGGGRHIKKKDLALSHLRQEILNQNLKPGTLITAKALAEKWDISRTPVRGAIEVLVKEGLLKKIGEAGVMVREINAEELYELLTLRFAIETKVAWRLACMKTDDMLQKLDDLNEQIHAAVESDSKDDWPGYYKLDIEFHVTMAKLANMNTAANWIAELMNQFRLYALDYRGVASKVYEEHTTITKSIKLFSLKNKDKLFIEIQRMIMNHLIGTADRWAVNIMPWIEREWKVGELRDSKR